MFKLKSIDLNDSKRISILFDTSTALPCLYPTLYILSSMKYKSESTQQAYLLSIKRWYEFWQEKHNEAFCYYFYKHKSNPYLMIEEIDSFILYLENNNSIDDKLIRLSVNPAINLSTLSHRLRAILNYFEYLLDNFSQVHGQPLKREIIQYKSILINKHKLVAKLSAGKHTPHKAGTSFKSLTEEMKDALNLLISPLSEKPLFESKQAQLRNFLIVHLLINYGLRTGELLLLSLDSIKRDLKTGNYHLLVIDTEDEHDTRRAKPHIKNTQSIRKISLDKRDANFIEMYINNIRYQDSPSKLLFLSLQAPYSPLSKSALKKILSTINIEMQSKYPRFFDPTYIDSIDKISAHILRHTWSYLMLKYSYEYYLNNHNNQEAMTRALEDLRKMAGWSLNSTMPYLYANRFISENANSINLQRMNVKENFYE